MSENILTYEKTIQAPISQVFKAFTNSSALREWLCDLAITDPKPEGRIYLAWNDGYFMAGEFTIIEKERLAAFSWLGRGESAPTQVQVELSARDGGTHLKLVHSGLGSTAEWEKTRHEFDHGWQSGLENLAHVLEKGPDLRIVRRPMLGITLDTFDEETAKKLSIPVTQGIRLSGVVDGMGAQKAGFQANDVLVAMEDVPLESYGSFAKALGDHIAGDEVKVDFYRGSEKKQVAMILSGRPLLEIPASVDELARIIRNQYEAVESRLFSLFEGVKDEAASARPAGEEWSAKETLVHLIHSERGNHTFIRDLVGNAEPVYDNYVGNEDYLIKATLKAYPTLKSLLEELVRCDVETIEMISTLPGNFVDRKSTFWRLVYNTVGTPYHFDAHADQITGALESAKEKLIS